MNSRFCARIVLAVAVSGFLFQGCAAVWRRSNPPNYQVLLRLEAAPGMEVSPEQLKKAHTVVSARMRDFAQHHRVESIPPDQLKARLKVTGESQLEALTRAIVGGYLSFHIAYDGEGAVAKDTDIAEREVPPGYSAMPMRDQGGTCFVKSVPELTGESIVDAKIDTDELTGRPVVTFTIDREGSETLYRVTSESVGKSLALALDGRVVLLAKIAEGIRDRVKVTGVSLEEARELTAAVRLGAGLPCPLRVVSRESLE